MFSDDVTSIRKIWELGPIHPHWHMSDKVVNVTVAPTHFHDLESMQKITAETLGILGCGGCHSGWDIRWLLEREFHVNPEGNVVPGPQQQYGR